MTASDSYDPERRRVLAQAQTEMTALMDQGRLLATLDRMRAIPPGPPPPPDLQISGLKLLNSLSSLLLFRGFFSHSQAIADQLGPLFATAHRVASNAYRDDLTQAQRFADRQRLAAAMRARTPNRPPQTRPIDLTRPLRVGHILNSAALSSSEHFRRHEIALHDRDRVQLVHYLRSGAPPEAERRPEDRWVDTGRLDDAAFCDQVRADDIDILVDHCDCNSGNRLSALAAQPAPVILGRGGLGSCALPSVAWRLGDLITHPIGGAEPYQERILRLPLLQCYAPPLDAPAPELAPPDFDPMRPLWFGAFCQPAKITLATAQLWAAILRAAPQARLRIKRKELTSPDAQARLTQMFKTANAPLDRIVYSGPSDRAAHFNAIAEVDVALDPFPFGGHTTTCECLWMGTPVVGMMGDSLVSRWGPSYLTGAGYGHWVARDAADYLRIALDLVRDRDQLMRIRAELRARIAASPLCDGAAWTRSMEDGYRLLAWDWNERRAGGPGLQGR